MTGGTCEVWPITEWGMERQDKDAYIMGLHFYMYGEQNQGREQTSGQDEFQCDVGVEVPKVILRIKQLKLVLVEETELKEFLETQLQITAITL